MHLLSQKVPKKELRNGTPYFLGFIAFFQQLLVAVRHWAEGALL